MSLSEDLQAVARRLLEEEAVDVVIGHARGTLPLRSTPVFVRSAEDATMADRTAVMAWSCPACGAVGAVKYGEHADVYGVSRQFTEDHRRRSPDCQSDVRVLSNSLAYLDDPAEENGK